MMDTLRAATKGWVAKVLLGLLVLSFAVWGISDAFINSGQGDQVMEAGNSSVSQTEYRLAFDRQLQVLSQQFGQRVSSEQARSFGIDRQVAGQLASGLVLDELASSLNLGLSKDRLATLTAEDPAFQGANGQFERFRFDQALRNAGMRPEDYLLNREQVAKRQQIVESAMDGTTVPKAFLEAMSIYDAETRDVNYIVLPTSLVAPAEPTEADLTTYFETNKTRYRKPEYRDFRYLRLSPEDVAAQVPIEDSVIREDYDRNIARFTTAEQRRIEQIVFPNIDDATVALDRIKAGETFEDILADRGITVGDALLGTVTKADISDSTVADAAFALEENAVSDVIAGIFGPILLRVTAISEAKVEPYEAVKDTLKNELALNEGSNMVLELHDTYEDARGGGDSMAEAASKIGLTLTEQLGVDRSGAKSDGTILRDLPVQPQLLGAVFEADIGEDAPPLLLGASGFVWYDVVDITPDRDATLEEVRVQVSADWTRDETARLLGEKAQALVDALNVGTSLETIATDNSLTIANATRIARDSTDAALGANGIAAAFGGSDDHAAVVTAPDGESQIILQVNTVNRPNADIQLIDAQTQSGLSQAMSNDLVEQMIAQLQTIYPVTINQSAIERALQN